jgi:O-antigen ligase
MNLQLRLFLIPLGMAGLLILFLGAERRPAFFANTTYLGALIVLELVVACLWLFDKVFFPVTIGCFLLAGTGLPLSGESTTLRWLFLAVGGTAGLVIWLKSSQPKHFESFHLVALFCVFSALASASASELPAIALLKVLSLFLLFLYASTGARVAFVGREESFIRGLVLTSEVLVYVTSACYLIGYDLFGNPNALGAVVGIAIAPVMLWAALTGRTRWQRQRRYIALALCGALLYVSVCRAAILADAVVIIVLTVALRRPRMLVRVAFAAALFLGVMAVANPAHMGEFVDSFSGRFILKEHGAQLGAFASRQGPWESTISAVSQHPWFGTGFGTSDLGTSGSYGGSSVSDKGSNPEHGSSYLALAEYLGLLGFLPFLILLLLLLRGLVLICTWMRRTGSAHHYGVPFALIVVAGLVHASFEDWLLAPGSYLCVFFWISVFLLVDLDSVVKADLRSAASSEFFSVSAQARSLRQPTNA